MIRVLSARRRLTPVVTGPLAAVAAALMLTSSASAAMPAGDQAPANGRGMQILFSMVRVYATPSMHAAVQGKLATAGSAVSVACWTSGMDYKNVAIWYQLSAPVAG